MWRGIWLRYQKIGLQWRIMIYVTAGLIVFSAVYAIAAQQAVQQASNLVFQERVSLARSLAREIDQELGEIQIDPSRASPTVASSPNGNLVPQSYQQIAAQIETHLVSVLEDYHIELLDQNGVTVYSNANSRPFSISQHGMLVQPYLLRHEAGTYIHRISGGEHIIAFAPLTRYPLMVVVEQNTDEAFALPREMQSRLVGFGLFAVIGGLVLALMTTRRVVRPVNRLISASKEIAQGNLDRPLDVSAEGEIGALARSFDEMRVQLKESNAKLSGWNRELETRVQKRTRELAALVESLHTLTSTLNLDTLFGILIRETRAVLPMAEGIALFLFERQTENLTARTSFGFDQRECGLVRFRLGEGIAGQVFATQKPLLLTNAADVVAAQANLSSENLQHFANAAGNRQMQSALGIPLISKGTCLGVLMAYNFSAESAFTAGDVPVLQAFADQAAAAFENAQLYAELEHKEEIHTHLLEKVIEAQEDERKRIARELHDELGQTLTALTIDLQTAARRMPDDMHYLKRRLEETETLTAQTLKEMSQLILELRPSVLDDLGLVPAIRRYAENRLEAAGTRVNVDASSLKHRLPPSIETTLFRILQEAINNAARYAHASRVDIRLMKPDGMIRAEVEDDGSGFDAEEAFQPKDEWRGLGLLGMRERATLLGGTLTIDSKVGRGTRVRAEIPWKQAD